MSTFRASDSVFHVPSHWHWTLAVDEVDGRVMRCGRTYMSAAASDCTLHWRATNSARLEKLEEWASKTGKDIRISYAREQLAADNEKYKKPKLQQLLMDAKATSYTLRRAGVNSRASKALLLGEIPHGLAFSTLEKALLAHGAEIVFAVKSP